MYGKKKMQKGGKISKGMSYKMGGGYMKKMKKGGKTGKYNCSHNRLY